MLIGLIIKLNDNNIIGINKFCLSLLLLQGYQTDFPWLKRLQVKRVSRNRVIASNLEEHQSRCFKDFGKAFSSHNTALNFIYMNLIRHTKSGGIPKQTNASFLQKKTFSPDEFKRLSEIYEEVEDTVISFKSLVQNICLWSGGPWKCDLQSTYLV